jgi:hypothetical protein
MNSTASNKEYSQIEEFLDGFGDEESDAIDEFEASVFNSDCLKEFEEICMAELLGCLNGFGGQYTGIQSLISLIQWNCLLSVCILCISIMIVCNIVHNT